MHALPRRAKLRHDPPSVHSPHRQWQLEHTTAPSNSTRHYPPLHGLQGQCQVELRTGGSSGCYLTALPPFISVEDSARRPSRSCY